MNFNTGRRTLIVSALSAVVLSACTGDGRLTVHTTKGDFAFTVELAATPEARQQGLMFRQELAPDAGMLFDFETEQDVSFWMRNTFIPLDMIFIAADGVVRSVHVNARPHDPTGISSGGPVRFVLEIPGGRSREIGVAPGDHVGHNRISN